MKTSEGVGAGEWRLESCEPLPKPPLEELADEDCYTLIFSCEPGFLEKHYDLTAEDGFAIRLYAVPMARDRMCVTIN